jgi:hypothetical protein
VPRIATVHQTTKAWEEADSIVEIALPAGIYLACTGFVSNDRFQFIHGPAGVVCVRLADPNITISEMCVRCEAAPSTGLCCSSHRKGLCHRCYRRTHFVEVCVAGCSACAREGLSVKLEG